MNIVSFNEYKRSLTSTNMSNEESQKKLDNIVLPIIQDVRNNGDQALYRYAEKFDQVKLDQLTVKEEEWDDAKNKVDASFLSALKEAKENIAYFHEQQMEKSWFIQKENNIMLGQQVTPMEKVGIYVPGGKAAYPSTVLMNVIPAKIAGVEKVRITTPPQTDGKVNPYVLAAASVAGVDRIYKIGGAQAIAALAYGTETIEKVDKIVGPGNAFVARAKKWVYGDVAIDMIAGPSEICIVADDSTRADFVAADLLSQAEHDEEATSILITTSESLATKVKDAVMNQLEQLERMEIAKTSIEKNGKIILVDSLQKAFEIVNELAPEHLQLMIEHASDYLGYVRHAGAIFLGNYSPEPLGDYFAGPNHTLPTSGTAKFSSPLGVYDFLKKSSIIRYSKDALNDVIQPVSTLANMEGLTAHAKSMEIRKDID